MTDTPSLAPRPPAFLRRHIASGAADRPELLIGLACDEAYWVRREAAKNPATPRWVIDLLVRAGADADLRGRSRPDPDMDPADLRRLVECGPWAQELVAEHPNTASHVLDVLADQSRPRLRASVAEHPNTASSTLARLCADAEEVVRRAANAHPDRPEDTYRLLCALGADHGLVGLDAVDRVANVDATTLRAAARLGPFARFLAARHALCPEDVLARVAIDTDWRVRSGIFDNPEASSAVVARAADVEVLDDTACGSVDELRVLAHRAAPAASLAALVDDPRPAVRLAVARHRAAGRDLLGTLAADASAEVRRVAARHPQIDPDDIDLLVRAGSSADLMRLSDPDPDLPPEAIDRLSRGGRWAKQLAVRHPATMPDTLARLLCDEDGKIREWAAAHPSAPAHVMADLRRAGGAEDFQGLADGDPDMPADALRRIAELGPWGAMIVSWHPNAPVDLARSPT